MKDLGAFKSLLASPKKIVITTHLNPDADALGSSLGLYNFLLKKGHEAKVITPTGYPEFLHWMPGNDQVIVYADERKKEISRLIDEAEMIFCLDFSDLARIKELGALISQATGKKILVDHHLDPDRFADFESWDPKAAATAELIYDLIVELDSKNDLDAVIAECLYAGIMTDTGNFRHSSTSPKIHRVVATLMEAGADVTKVSRLIYDNYSLNRLRFLGYALMERLEVLPDSRVAFFVISAEDHERFQLKSGDTEGLVNYALSINGIMVAATIMEREQEVKLSFRSKGEYAVNTFAATYFDGGGHKNAAGGSSDKTLEETVTHFRKLAPQLTK